MSSNTTNIFIFTAVIVVGYLGYRKYSNRPKRTLFERLGGDAAMEAAVTKFYARVLADSRVNYFFKDTNMTTQHKTQLNFMSVAFGKQDKYSGLAMNIAHKKLIDKMGMNDSHFDAIAEDLKLTLEEMGVSKELVNEAITAVGGLREQVMCRGKYAL